MRSGAAHSAVLAVLAALLFAAPAQAGICRYQPPVGMISEVPHGPMTAGAHGHTLSVTLAAPLGGRTVRSIQTGRAVRVKAPS